MDAGQISQYYCQIQEWGLPLFFLVVGQWESHLKLHPDQNFAGFIVRGLREGFHIGFSSKCERASRNMLSATQHPEVMKEYLREECSQGRIMGPLDPSKFPDVHISRFGVIPKKSGKWRLIVDLSHPPDKSVNNGIQGDACSLTYMTVADAVEVIAEQGQGTLLAKVDVKSAYRIIPVHPEDHQLLGMLWGGALFVDTALPLGLRSAPKIFNAVADALEWMAGQEGITSLFHYLNDFLIVGSPGSLECSRHLTILLALFEQLGVPVAMDKVEGPITSLTFLGIQIDTISMELHLPEERLMELRQLVGEWMGKKTCTRKDLQSLVGKLQHACKVVKPGRTFMRRIFELLGTATKMHHHIRLNLAIRSDLLWWNTFLVTWNGVAMVSKSNAEPWATIFTDASGRMGCGAWWGHQWLQLKWCWVRDFGNLLITQKEVLPVVLACAEWGNQWGGKLVQFYCDNEAAVTVITTGYSRDPHIMHLLRSLFFIKAHLQIDLRVSHIAGKSNSEADAISHDNLQSFFLQVPQANNVPAQIPEAVLALVAVEQQDWSSPSWMQLFANCFRLA